MVIMVLGTSKLKISAVKSLCMLHNMCVCVYAFTKFNLQVDMSGLTFALYVALYLAIKLARPALQFQSFPSSLIPSYLEMHLLYIYRFFSCLVSTTEFVLYTLQQTTYYNGSKTITLKCGWNCFYLFLFIIRAFLKTV